MRVHSTRFAPSARCNQVHQPPWCTKVHVHTPFLVQFFWPEVSLLKPTFTQTGTLVHSTRTRQRESGYNAVCGVECGEVACGVCVSVFARASHTRALFLPLERAGRSPPSPSMGKHTFGQRALADVAALGDHVVTGVRARRKKVCARHPCHSYAACLLQLLSLPLRT